MFEQLENAPPDAILGLTEIFKKDPNPDKINLGVGVYKDASGATPILDTVKEAENRLLEEEHSKSYLSIEGSPEYGRCVQELLFGAEHEAIAHCRAATAQTPGGTAALRVAGEFIKHAKPGAAIWMSKPTWANHGTVFSAAGLELREYPYYNAETKSLDFSAMLNALRKIPSGDVVLLHACCHNPTGVDPDLDEWHALAEVASERGWTPLIDFAYQGFADGLEEDAQGLLRMVTPGCELLICSSFSKNFGLYNERVGALTVVGAAESGTQKALGHIKRRIRASYSNPPSHGGAIVTTILSTPELRARWIDEVTAMRDRINGMRTLFVETLKAKGVKQDFSFITEQRGMFSFSGLNDEQVQTLRDKYAIYIVGGGRINVAGMTEHNMERLCQAIAEVL